MIVRRERIMRSEKYRLGSKMLKYRKPIAIAAAVIIAAGALITAKNASQADATTTMIKDATAQTGTVAKTISASGTLSDDASINVKVPAGVVISEVCVSAGDSVKKGDVLAKIDRASAAKVILELKDERSDIKTALSALTGTSDTTSDSYLKKVIYESEISDLDDAIDKLTAMLDSGTIKAAKSGTVTSVNVTEGESVSENTASGNSGSGSGSTMSASTASTGITTASTTSAVTSTASTGITTASTTSAATSEMRYSSLLEAVENGAVSNDLILTAAEDSSDSGTEGSSEAEVSVITESDLSTLTVAQPADGAAPQSSIASTSKYSASISWNTSSTFVGGNKYTATIELTSNKGYCFSGSYNIQFAGGTLTDGTPKISGEGSGNKLIIKADFTATGSSDSASENSGSTGGNSGNSGSSGNSSAAGGSAGTVRKSSGSGSSSGSSGSSGTASSTTSSLYEDTSLNMVTAFSMSSDDQMTVVISVDESDINSVKTGQTATVSLDAVDGEGFDGEITEVNSASSSESGGNVKYAVTVTIDKTDDMKSGMTASAVINIEEAENVIMIPSAAVNEKGGKTFVYTKNDNGTLSGETEIETGLSNGNQVEVTSGLDEGTTVYYEVRQSGSSEKSGGNENGGMHGMGERPDMGSMPSGGPGGNGGGMQSGGQQ